MTYSKPAIARQRLQGLLNAPSGCDCVDTKTEECKNFCSS